MRASLSRFALQSTIAHYVLRASFSLQRAAAGGKYKRLFLLCGLTWFMYPLPHLTLAYEQALTSAVSDVQELAVRGPGESHDQASNGEVRVVGVQ